MHSYPYRSRLRNSLRSKIKGIDYETWQVDEIQAMVQAITKPVVEIGGPTQDGFYYLDNIGLDSKPIITNISPSPLPLSQDAEQLANQVNEIFDATKMRYADNSVGMFLMAAMSISSDWWVELSEIEKEKARATFEAEFSTARFEMGQIAAGIVSPQVAEQAQRVKIYLEVARCLQKNGLFFSDGGIEEISILKQIGFELVACLQVIEEYGISYEFVVSKRF